MIEPQGMKAKSYQTGCDGCKRSQGLDDVKGGILMLPGDWVVNQYAGEEGYLGWLAMQPRFHAMAISELDQAELSMVGPNIQRLDALLTEYWQGHFSADPLCRVHVVYFFESVFDQPPTKFHLHIHLIPRTDQIGCLLREGSGINAWRTPEIWKNNLFPAEYRRTESNVNVLMGWLRNNVLRC